MWDPKIIVQLIYKTEIVTDGGNTFMVTKRERLGGMN